MRTKHLKDGGFAMTTQSKEIFTTPEVAEMFSVVPATVDKWRKSGRLHGLKLSHNQVRFSREAITEFIATEQAKAAQQ